MLATLHGKPTDQIPWAPRMDLWMIAQRERGLLPPEYADMNMVELSRALGVACHAVGGDFSLPGERDVRLRGLGIDNHRDYPYRVELRGLDIASSHDDTDLITAIKTPFGPVNLHLHHSKQMARDGISLPFVKSYAIDSPDDFDAVATVFEHLELIPTPEAYRAFDARVGDQGIAVARGPVAASPMHLILHELTAMQNFFYLYADARDGLRSLAARMEPFFEAALDTLLECDAEVIFWGANYDQDVTWPPFFEQEIAPWLQRVSKRVHAAGKLLLTHCDGENRALLPLYPACGFDVAESVCPSPMTRCTLAEIREGMGPDTTIWGGIPSVLLLEEYTSDYEFNAYMGQLLDSVGRGDRLILGVSDNVPPDASLERLDSIKRTIAEFGPVAPTMWKH